MGKRKLKNIKSGKAFYGLHFQPGVAEYPDHPFDESGRPSRYYIDEVTAKRMNPTFVGKPVFVDHTDVVNDDIFQEADGYVWESFFNKCDGNHWVKFIVTTERGIKAIEQDGWKLSNAYFVKNKSGPGEWHSVPYDNQIVEAEYEHLAIVKNPRYEESVILTTQEYKEYITEKEQELLKMANSKTVKGKFNKSKKRKTRMFNLFKKIEVEDSENNVEDYTIKLPRSGKEMDLKELVKNADEAMLKAENEGDHKDDPKNKRKKNRRKKNKEMKDPDEEGMDNDYDDDDEMDNEYDDDEMDNEDDDDEMDNDDDDDDEKMKSKRMKSKRMRSKKNKSRKRNKNSRSNQASMKKLSEVLANAIVEAMNSKSLKNDDGYDDGYEGDGYEDDSYDDDGYEDNRRSHRNSKDTKDVNYILALQNAGIGSSKRKENEDEDEDKVYNGENSIMLATDEFKRGKEKY